MHRTKQRLATSQKPAATCRASSSLEALARADAEACSTSDGGPRLLAATYVSSSWDKYSHVAVECYPSSAIRPLPWADSFPHLVSFWEMVIYPAWQLCEAIQMLAELDFVAETETLNGLAKFDVSDEKYKGVILGRLRYIRQHCELIELVTADRYIQRKIADFERSATPSELQHEAKTIRELIRVDLWERRFTYIPMDKAKTLLDLDQNWAVVWLKFPNEVEIDSREAVECYSLGRNTACVFHLMRVVEFGMRSLAASLKVKNIKSGKQGKAMTPIAWAEWQTIIEAMEQALANMSNMKRGAKKAADQAFYHRAMLDLRSFKDAFRNHVMHARVSYDEHQAMSIMNHTRAFMTSIATRAVK